MHDFEKEELEYLMTCPSVMVKKELAKKIQSMIDNYCEHPAQEAMNHCVDCGVSEYRCLGCLTVSYEGLK